MWSFFSRDPSKDFLYEIVEQTNYLQDKSIWTLHKAKKKGTNEEVSVFTIDVHNTSDTQYDIAKSSVKRLKTLRHPSILTYLDSLETDKVLYLATEYVEPLFQHLARLNYEGQQKDLYLAWGIFQITRALSFLNNDCNLRHNNVNIWSVFVNSSGEWKLSGVEYIQSAQQHSNDQATNSSGATIFPTKITPALQIYDPPEKNDLSHLRHATKCSSDMWGLGCLIWEAFNGPLQHQPSLKKLDNIPKQLQTLYCELVGSNPSTRPNPADIITRCRKQGGYFKNDLVDTLLFLEEIQIKDKMEKSRFFLNLTPQLDNFPSMVNKHKILPQLITAFEYGDAGSAVLAPMFKLGRLLDEDEYQRKIVPCVVKLFNSNDRATRSRLLQQLEHFINHLESATVNQQIFPQIVHGFLDTNATIREQTVKSIIHLAPKLNYNNLNVEVLRHFARLQAKDEQGGIRTNTTVCLGKIAQHLHPLIRQKILISAFIRAMRDPFPPARNAGILALAATQQYFLLNDVATRILPALCHLTIDPEKMVRDSVFRTIKGFLGKLEKVSEDPSLRESMEADVNTATPSLSNAAATWAGWAVTAVTAKFYRSQSDTVKSITPLPSKSTLSKPASLEQPSSSSISTTTSSVTSMTSLEQEDCSKGNESLSDYDHWDQDNWGDMETSNNNGDGGGSDNGDTRPNSLSYISSSTTRLADGWDNEEWGSLEEEPAELISPSEAWKNDSTMTTVPENSTLPSSNRERVINRIELNDTNVENNENQENNSLVNNKFEEARKKREERKLQRQKELEARRASRNQTGGPMKLASKKI